MSATEELRRLLGERGVKWWPMHDVENGYHQDRDTEFVIDGKKYTAHEWGGTLNVYGFAPQQAIVATLGSTYEPPLACHWDGDVLVLTVPRDPSSIHVQRAEGQPRKVYSGEPELVSTHAVIVSDESTDCATGHCECELCGKPIDMWDKFCCHCGAKVLQPVVMGKGER